MPDLRIESMRILVVDDNNTVRTGIRSLLRSLGGFLVCGEAAGGVAAVEKDRELRPDVILMDVSMPRMDGLQAARIIRRELPETKVIIVSQNDPAIVRAQAANVQADAFIAKADLANAHRATEIAPRSLRPRNRNPGSPSKRPSLCPAIPAGRQARPGPSGEQRGRSGQTAGLDAKNLCSRSGIHRSSLASVQNGGHGRSSASRRS